MLQLKNTTPFKAEIMPLPNRDGVDTIYAVVKATFTVGEQVTLADEQLPVTLADVHHGDPGSSSIRVPSDVSLDKPGTDVVVLGSAWAPRGTPAWQMDVAVRVATAAKAARVYGDRVWDARAGGASVAWVAPFIRMPVVWERAFGGTDQTDKGPAADSRNPVGIGFRAPNSSRPLAGMPLPNVEDPAAPISSWKDVPTPTGFAPVSPHWMPRRAYAGTYDDTWQQKRAPFLPADFDPRFFQMAPAGLALPYHLRGGEPVELSGMTPAGALRFQLPTIGLQVRFLGDGGPTSRPGLLDTLIIEPDAGRVAMVWRASHACDKKTLKVREVAVSLAGPA